jgi:hypothetical protein
MGEWERRENGREGEKRGASSLLVTGLYWCPSFLVLTKNLRCKKLKPELRMFN